MRQLSFRQPLLLRRPLRSTARAATVLVLALATTQPAIARADGQPLTLEAIFASDAFDNRLPRDLRWQPSGQGLTYIDTQSLKLWPVDGNNARTLIPANLLEYQGNPIRPEQAQWSPDLRFALVQSNSHTTWNGYTQAHYYLFDTERQQWRPLADGSSRVQHAYLSPNGSHVAYVLDNNLYIESVRDGKTTRVTTDGNGDIFNGVFDYGSSEFGGTHAWHWSPDSRHIAFWRLDASAVPEYPLIDELGNYSQVHKFHYPNAGQKHAVNQVGVYDLHNASTRWLEPDIDPDDYLPTLDWGSDGRYLFVQHLTRDQNTLRLLRFDLAGGGSEGGEGYEVPLTETDPAWIDITDDFTALSGGDDFLWTSERSGYRHIYRYRDGTLSPLTRGDWSVDAIVGVSPAEEAVYFYAKKDSLVDQYVYRVPLAGGEPEKVSKQPGWHQWQLAPDGRHAITHYSNAHTPPVIQVRDLPGDKHSTLAANQVRGMRDFAMTHTEFVQFDTDDGITLNGYFIKPPGFDPSKRYPVIAYAYGNAGSQIVVNRWGTQRGPAQDLWHRYMAQQGYVIFAMDNRTTTGRGKAAKNLTYGHYAKYAVLDELQGVEFLKSLPWVDPERIGFWGWSGGGYLAAALMTKGAPHFKVAVSVAPVIDLTRYQAVGVERWMGSPAENPEGYAAVNLMNDADRLQGKLLLMHGTGDENVKFAFTLQFINALIAANKQFDMVVYPNRRHTIADARLHVFSTITRYFNENL